MAMTNFLPMTFSFFNQFFSSVTKSLLPERSNRKHDMIDDKMISVFEEASQNACDNLHKMMFSASMLAKGNPISRAVLADAAKEIKVKKEAGDVSQPMRPEDILHAFETCDAKLKTINDEMENNLQNTGRMISPEAQKTLITIRQKMEVARETAYQVIKGVLSAHKSNVEEMVSKYVAQYQERIHDPHNNNNLKRSRSTGDLPRNNNSDNIIKKARSYAARYPVLKNSQLKRSLSTGDLSKRDHEDAADSYKKPKF